MAGRARTTALKEYPRLVIDRVDDALIEEAIRQRRNAQKRQDAACIADIEAQLAAIGVRLVNTAFGTKWTTDPMGRRYASHPQPSR